MFAAGDNSREPLYAPKILVDSTVSTTTIMTTGSLSVTADYPFLFDNVIGGLKLRGTGGIWGYSGSWSLTRDNYPDLYSLIAHYNPGGGNRMAINTDVATTTGTASLTLGPGGNVGSDEATYYLIMRDYLGVNAMSVDRDGNMDVLGNIVSQADITAGTTFIVDDVTINDAGVAVTNGDVSVGNGNISVSGTGDVTVGSGKIESTSGQVIAGAGPFIDPQVAIIAASSGGIVAYNIGAEQDLHAGISGYAKRSWVVGEGAQHFGHHGAFVITTNGSGTAPYPGFARGSIYADQNGVRYTVLASAPPYVGSLGNWHNFDATVATSGSLESSGSLILDGGATIIAPSGDSQINGPLTVAARMSAGQIEIFGSDDEGQATILNGDSSVIVSTPAIAALDTPPVSYTTVTNGGGALYTSDIIAGSEFVIRSTNVVSDDTVVNWKIIH